MSSFCHLHTHSEYSILDGQTTVQDIVQIVKDNGDEAVGLTDHGTLAGSLKFWKAGKEHGIKTIQGKEAYVTPDLTVKEKDTPIWHMTLLAMNEQGLHNLFALSRIGWTEGFYKKPRIDYKALQNHSEGIIALSGCMGGEVSRAIERKDLDEASEAVRHYVDIFGDRYYIELQPGNRVELNSSLASIGVSLGVPLVVTVDSHYGHCEDKSAQELLLLMQQVTGMKASDKSFAQLNYQAGRRESNLLSRLNMLWPNRNLRFDEHDLYLMSREEVVSRMNEQGFDGNALADTTLEIAERCEQIDFNTKTNYLPTLNKKLDSEEYLRELVIEGLRDKKLHKNPIYLAQAEHELKEISDKGFCDYFLIVWDLINEARNRNIYVGPGRGSAAGSLAAYALKITSIDPIKYNLLFFRFIDPERPDFPDIDMDFEARRRDEMKDYLKEKYGDALSISTFTTLKSKSLIKSISRVLSIPLSEVEAACKQFNEIEDYETSDGTKSFRAIHPEILPLAHKLQGHISASGMHAAAVVVANKPITEIVPVETRPDPQNPKGNRVPVTAYDMKDCAEVNLIKFDFLGLMNLDVIHDTIDLIKERHDINIDWENLEPDDPFVLKMLSGGNTIGIFQMESSPYRNLLINMGVDNFYDVVASNALVRPGAFNTVAKDYINRKKGLEEVTYPHESVEKYLKNSYGVVIYQEQIMQLAVELGGFSWAEASDLRRLIGKKVQDAEQWAKWKDKWIDGAKEKIGGKEAKKLWKDFLKHADYSFNLSHAVCYSYTGYVTAWLKFYYPLEYMYGLLKNEGNDSAKMTYLLEAKRLGIQILPPDINDSNSDMGIDGEALRFGLRDIKSVGVTACNAIMAARPFSSWEDFEERVPARKCNKTVKEALVAVDAFASVEGAPRHPNPEENYLEYLNYPILLEKVADIGISTTSIEAYNSLGNKEFGVVCAVVKSTKRTDTYFRLELEDLTSNLTVFGGMDCDLSSGDTIIALVGDNTLVGYTNVDGLKERQELGTINDFEKWLLYEPLEDFKLLTKFGMGLIWEPKSLLIPLQVRVVTTKAGKHMCFAYLSDRDRNVVKVTIFPAVWEKMCSSEETELHSFRPICAQLSRLDDGGLTIWSNGIIDAELKLKEKEKLLK